MPQQFASSRATRTPHPYFVNKFSLFMGLQEGYRCKILSAKNLAAESSRVRTYDAFCLVLATDRPRTTFLHCSYRAPTAANDSQNCAEKLKPELVRSG